MLDPACEPALYQSNQSVIYLDNAATTWPKPESVYQTWTESFRHMVSPKRGTAAAKSTDLLAAARHQVSRFLGIPAPERLIFTAGCTASLNMAIQAFPWQPGDGVIISGVEHHALSRPIRKMVERHQLRLFVVPYTDEIPFDMEAYATLLKTQGPIRMVATTHASNVIGSILPIEEIGLLAQAAGAAYLVDAAQTAGYLPLNVAELPIDMIAFPGHKSLYGPPGVGGLYVSERVALDSFMEGGTGNDSGKHAFHPTLPDGFEVGTIPLPQIRTLAAGVGWLEQQDLAELRRHEQELLGVLLSQLNTLPELVVYGHQRLAEKTPVVSWNVKSLGDTAAPKTFAGRLSEEYGVALRAGFHCAPMAHEALGTLDRGGTIRVSLGAFTTEETIKQFVQALKTVLVRSVVTG